MGLLDLPAELVAEILQHTVIAVGFGRAFRLRLVCRTFDAEVLRAIFATRVIEDYPRGIRPHSGAIAVVSRYLESRSLADLKNRNQFTAAIRRAAETLVVGNGVGLQHTWNKNISALCQAATIHCGPETVLCLLDSKEDGNSAFNESEFIKSIMKIEDEMDVFVGAAYTGNITKVRDILGLGRDVQRGSRFFGYPLQCACSEGHKNIVILLLEHGADINHGKAPICDVFSDLHHSLNFGTPLQSACLGGHEDIVRLLLEPKHELSTSCSEFNIAALQAARGGHFDIVRLLEEATSENIQRGNLLSEASKYGQRDFVHKVLDNETFTVPNLEFTLECCLYEAANRGYHEAAQLLLAHGTERKYGGLRGPLCAAGRGGYERVVRLLLEYGANSSGWPNALIAAASEGQAHIVSLLLESRVGLNMEGCDDQAVSALEAALIEGYESVVRIFFHHGVTMEGKSEGSAL